MQDRYAGDIGDYVKLALLRALAPGRKLGVAWYLYPDEGHNSDGRHTAYLTQPSMWRPLDPELFDALQMLVRRRRSVADLETLNVVTANFSRRPLNHGSQLASARPAARAAWFEQTLTDLADCDLAFADPDNGLIDVGQNGIRFPASESICRSARRAHSPKGDAPSFITTIAASKVVMMPRLNIGAAD